VRLSKAEMIALAEKILAVPGERPDDRAGLLHDERPHRRGVPRMRDHHRGAADPRYLTPAQGMVGHGYQTDWAITTVNPQPYFDCLAATVEQLGATRSVLRQVIMLADDAASHRENSHGWHTALYQFHLRCAAAAGVQDPAARARRSPRISTGT
jgi:hypothetical protein